MPRFPAVSPTTATLSDAVFSQLAAKPSARAGALCPLHVGDTWREPPLATVEPASLRPADRLHIYAPVQGEPELLSAISDAMRGGPAEAPSLEQIQVVPGATAGLCIAVNALLDPGDELLLPAPFWPLIRGIVAARGARPVEVPFFDRLGQPGFDPQRALEQAVTERTAALYLNTPHNPTGRILPEDVLDAALRVARRHDLWVLCDEAYERLWFGPEPPAPAWGRPDAVGRAVVCHTLSKSHGLAGARVGWIHGPPEAMRAIRGLQTFQTYCAARPMQLLAARALREGEGFVAEGRRLYAQAGQAAADTVGIDAPDGGTFLFFDASDALGPEAADSLPFLERCLDAGVVLTPGTACGTAYARWVRLCFTSVPPDALAAGLVRLHAVLGR